MKRALITGIVGQDGSYLAELLLSKSYEVHGLIRRSSSQNTTRIDGIRHKLQLHDGDLMDGGSLTRIVRSVRPHEVYNLAAQSFVAASFDEPDHTIDVTGLGCVRMLEAIRQSGSDARFYQASSSEMFGSTPPPQSEAATYHPRSPYSVAKVAAHHATVLYREAYKMHASCGILFNHESERRGETFVTRKITLAAARIKRGLQDKLFLGTLDAKRDWGYAPEFVEAMWRMLQQESPDDYVVATGEACTVRDFVEAVFAWHNLDWQKYVVVDPAFYRPAEVDYLCGDAAKAALKLGWKPTVKARQLARIMAEHDDKLLAPR